MIFMDVIKKCHILDKLNYYNITAKLSILQPLYNLIFICFKTRIFYDITHNVFYIKYEIIKKLKRYEQKCTKIYTTLPGYFLPK